MLMRHTSEKANLGMLDHSLAVTSSPPPRTGLGGPEMRLTPPPGQVVDALAGHCAEPSPAERVVSLHVLGPPVRRWGC